MGKVCPAALADGPAEYTPKELLLPSLTWVSPFVGMLLCIALLPLLPNAGHWWESNWAKLGVAVTLALVTASVYLFRPFGLLHSDAEGHKHVTQPGWPTLRLMLDHALLSDYVPFVVLPFSLYVISGGVRVRTNGAPTPAVNTFVLALGPGPQPAPPMTCHWAARSSPPLLPRLSSPGRTSPAVPARPPGRPPPRRRR